MQSLLRPYLTRFKQHMLSFPKSMNKFYHPSFLPQSFIATLSNSVKCHCEVIHLHQDNYIQEMGKIKKRIELNQCPSLAQFLGFSVDMQGDKAILYLFYEMGIKTFTNIIQQYSSHQEGFWRLLFPIVRAMQFLEKKKIHHRNLNYYNIIMDRESKIKVIYSLNQPTTIDLYYMDSQSSDWSYLFMSPQQMECQHNEDLQFPDLSDVFNLGAMFLTQLVVTKQGIYGDQSYLQKQIAYLKNKYSYSLCNILCKMLDLECTRRPTWFQLGLALDQLQKSIQVSETSPSRLFSDIAPRMTRDLLSMVDLKQTRRTEVSQFL